MSKWGPSNIRMLGASDVSTLLSKDAEISGTIKTEGSIRVDGTVIGDVISTKTVTIGATGVVEGNVTADEIIISGRVKGTLTAHGRIALESSAQLEGDLAATRLSVADGASFRGRSTMCGTPVHAPARRVEPEAADAPEPQRDRVAAA